MTDTNPQAAGYLLSFRSIDEKMCPAVQAADAGVYEVRRALNYPGLAGSLRKQFNVLADAKAIAYIAHSKRE